MGAPSELDRERAAALYAEGHTATKADSIRVHVYADPRRAL